MVHDGTPRGEDASCAQRDAIDREQFAGPLAFPASVSSHERPVVQRIRRHRQRLEGLYGVDPSDDRSPRLQIR